MKRWIQVWPIIVMLWGVGSESRVRAEAQLPADPIVESFSPQGYTPTAQKASVLFKRPLVPVGTTDSMSDPYTVQCAPRVNRSSPHVQRLGKNHKSSRFDSTSSAGKGRWLDPQHWIYDFDRSVAGGITCQFNPSRSAIKDNPLTQSFSFSTGGSSILGIDAPYSIGLTIPQDQIFALQLSTAPDVRSLESQVYFEVEGIAEKIPVRIVPRIPGLRKKEYSGDFFLQARRMFPPGRALKLIWPGVRAASGQDPYPDQPEQVFEWKVAEELSAQLNCSHDQVGPCYPTGPFRVQFSASIPDAIAKKVYLRRVDDPHGDKIYSDAVRLKLPRPEYGATDYLYFSQLLEPYARYQVVFPEHFRDEAGRSLRNPELFFQTGEVPSLVKIQSDFGIMEAQTDPHFPVTIQNLHLPPEVVVGKLRGTTSRLDYSQVVALLDSHHFRARIHSPSSHAEAGDFGEFSSWFDRKSQRLPEVQPRDHAHVVGIPLPSPGFYLVHIRNPPLQSPLVSQEREVMARVLVTNLAVHMKYSRESSLVWVTSLSQGLPESDVDVSLRDCEGKTLAKGRTDHQGIARFDVGLSSTLNQTDLTQRCKVDLSPDFKTGITAVAVKGEDFSLTHTSWEEGIESFRFLENFGSARNPESAATVLDRTLLMAGETVHMKHYFRLSLENGLAIPTPQLQPTVLKITHQETDETVSQPLAFKDGSALSDFTIPKTATLGRYLLTMTDPLDKKVWKTGSFQVQEFRVPLMRAQILAPASVLATDSEVPVRGYLEYLAGGPAKGAHVALRASLRALPSKTFPAYGSYTFSAGRIRLDGERPLIPGSAVSQNIPHTDAFGRFSSLIPLRLMLGRSRGVQQSEGKLLQLEIDYQDPSGEIKTLGKSIPVYLSSLHLGIQITDPYSLRDQIPVKLIAVDHQGKARPNVPIEVRLLQHQSYFHRKRLMGGYYANDSQHVVRETHEGEVTTCKGVTDPQGHYSCNLKPRDGGYYSVQAQVRDEQGGVDYTNYYAVVRPNLQVDASSSDSDRIDLTLTKKHFEPGETLEARVTAPFQSATALITVERDGVLSATVQKLTSALPFIHLPVLEQYTPNAVLSAFLVRGRLESPLPQSTLDLAKPAFRLGLTPFQVGYGKHRLEVEVLSDKSDYPVRGRARVQFKVRPSDGRPLPKGAEVAVAAVDEGLLALAPNHSWDLLQTMMGEREYSVHTCTSQANVIGKRHFGMKAYPIGGDGSSSHFAARELFHTLLYWNPTVRLNDQGIGEVEIPLNDSITSFQIAAIAHAGSDRFGTGTTSIRTHQDLILQLGLPPEARAKDQLDLRVILRNTTAEELRVDLRGQAQGGEFRVAFPRRTLKIAPHSATALNWKIQLPENTPELHYELSGQEVDGTRQDRVKLNQKIIPLVPIRVVAGSLHPLNQDLHLPVALPPGALSDRGGITLETQPSLLVGLGGLPAAFRNYPYTCLEQLFTTASGILLFDPTEGRERLSALAPLMPGYLDGHKLLRFFPSALQDGSESLTATILEIMTQVWDPNTLALVGMKPLIPQLKEGLLKYLDGHSNQGTLQPERLLRVLTALILSDPSSEQRATVQEHLRAARFNPDTLVASGLMDWLRILDASGEKDADPKIRNRITQRLRALLTEDGTRISLPDASYMDLQTTAFLHARLLMLALKHPEILGATSAVRASEQTGRLVQGLMSPNLVGNWGTPLANLYVAMALREYAARFESAPADGEVRFVLGAQASVAPVQSTSSTGAQASSIRSGLTQKTQFTWPKEPQELQIHHEGKGTPWLRLEAQAAIPRVQPAHHGFKVTKTIIPIVQANPQRWQVGDSYRVELKFENEGREGWVALEDPLPAGATILSSGKSKTTISPSFEERKFSFYRAYFSSLSESQSHLLEYTVRVNQAGHTHLPPTRIEALYHPEAWGESPNADFVVAALPD